MQGTRGEPPQTVKTMENLEKEAIIELKYSLHEIGLTSAPSEHVLFIKRAVRDCVACMSESAEPIDIEALKGQKFPRTYKDAYEHVLRHDGYPCANIRFIDMETSDGAN